MPVLSHSWLRALFPPLFVLAVVLSAVADESTSARPPTSDTDLRRWLENMVWHHQFSVQEIQEATGLPEDEITAALTKLDIRAATKPVRTAKRLLLLPYPGGRHPRIGFLDGAIDPQRETKASVFTPWDDSSYVVLDLPEAIWSNLGLTYLAHTHVPTIWDGQGNSLEQLEWQRDEFGTLSCVRRLPNDIEFGTRLTPTKEAIEMEMWLTNGTSEGLSDLRVQNCVMLKGAKGFAAQTNDNKVFWRSYAACQNESGGRWIITAWHPIQRGWGNPPCPCMHADPQFTDCAPGETQKLRGRLWFYEGDDLMAELKRLETTGWRKVP